MLSETLVDHFQSPRNVGEMQGADADGEDENPVCGDRLHVWVRVVDGSIAELTWKAEGCAFAIAAASMMSEMVRGMALQRACTLDREAIAEALGGLPPRKAHAAMLAVSALRRALEGIDSQPMENYLLRPQEGG